MFEAIKDDMKAIVVEEDHLIAEIAAAEEQLKELQNRLRVLRQLGTNLSAGYELVEVHEVDRPF